jgi:mannose-6-phosphate isomerase-like protein (cupin superfamily)
MKTSSNTSLAVARRSFFNWIRCVALVLSGVIILRSDAAAQVGPPSPQDTSAFRGNLFEICKQRPLPYEQNLTNLPIFSDSTLSAVLIQVREEVVTHWHTAHDEMVYILSGKAVMTVGEEIRGVQPGDVIFIRRNTPHKLENRSAQPLVALSVMSPPFDGVDRIVLEQK